MTTSSNRDYFFQTTAALDEQQRKEAKSKNSHGDPIKLESKILAIFADKWNPGSVYVAQSNGIVRRVVLETGQTNALYKGPEAPLTSLCVSPDGKVLFAGCWDKTVWSWDVVSREPRRQYEGHSDFVKSVIAMRIDGKDLLVSGGADAKVLVFDIETGERTRTFKGHLRGILDLAVDPGSETPEVVVFSAGSDRAIRQFTLTGGDDLSEPILLHKTSVNKLFFDADGDLWTASADRTAKCLVRADGWKDNLSLEHPDFVRDVLIYEDGGLVITACRDEEVRVWNRSTGQLHHTFSGHFEEVTGLALVGSTVVSVAIDGTIRQWSVRPDELQKAVDLSRNGPIVEKKPENEPVLTVEEERELAELMRE